MEDRPDKWKEKKTQKSQICEGIQRPCSTRLIFCTKIRHLDSDRSPKSTTLNVHNYYATIYNSSSHRSTDSKVVICIVSEALEVSICQFCAAFFVSRAAVLSRVFLIFSMLANRGFGFTRTFFCVFLVYSSIILFLIFMEITRRNMNVNVWIIM